MPLLHRSWLRPTLSCQSRTNQLVLFTAALYERKLTKSI